ncbi:MAG: transglycosylase domain-containing protein [Eubacteriales bacterium]|nr:transglycosylase domain-containing protein [Eubacteriales bacterium]
MSEYREQRTPRRSERRSGAAKKTRLTMIIGTILAIGLATSLMFFGIFMIYVHTALAPELDVDASGYTLKQSSTVYYQDRATGEWKELTKIHGTENRTLVDFEDIPDHVWQALVSIEDQRFFEHHGVDWKSTARSVFDMLRGSDSTRGGSTITQQVIKNLTDDNEVTIKRKVTEIFRALRFAKNYSREEVLELYLNLVYFGHGANGIQAAAEEYFGKDVSDLTVAEAASIVGITQYPSLYDPSREGTLNSGKTYREKNKERQETVLYKMNEQGYLSDEEYQAALNEKLVFVWDEDYVPAGRDVEVSAANTTYDSFFVEQLFNDVVSDMVEQNGYGKKVAQDMLYTGGYEIYCTVDPKVQEIVERVYADRSNLNYTSAKGEQLQSGMTIIDNTTGNVVAIAGRMGERGGAFEWSYAVNPRPCGSAIKPLAVYAPAIDAGVITPASVIDDYPVAMMGNAGAESIWPVNAYSGYKGIITLQDAVRFSANPTAVRVLQALTPSASYAFMTDKLNFTTLTGDDITAAGALALGGLSRGVTTLEMAAGYASFANNGIYTTPRTYTEVKNHNGKTVLENKSESHVAMKESTAYAMIDLLKGVVNSAGGTGTGAAFSGMTIAGKTGSTNSNCDRYFVGLTPYYTGAVWVGYDTPTRIVASGNPAATLWKKVMSEVHANLPNKNFNVSGGDMVSVTVCAQTGLLAGPSCASTHTVEVANGSAPVLTCDAHITATVCPESGLLASEHCPGASTVSVLDLSQSNVSEAWGYQRTMMYQPLTAAESATYAAQLEDGTIAEMPHGAPVTANDGSVRLYSDLMGRGMCTVHKSGSPTLPSNDPDTDSQTDGGDVASEENQNGTFLDWLLNTGNTNH